MQIDFSTHSHFEDFGKLVDAHRQDLIEKKRTIDVFCQNILLNQKWGPADYQLYQKYKNDLKKCIKDCGDDIKTLKLLFENKSILEKIETIIIKKDFFEFLDESRGLLTEAQISLMPPVPEFADRKPVEEESKIYPAEEHLFDLLDEHLIPPEKFMEAAEKAANPLSALLFMEKAASIYEKHGNLDSCLSIRREILDRFPIEASSRFYHLDQRIKELSSSQQTTPQLGVKEIGLDSGALRHGAMTLQKRIVEGRSQIHAILHLNEHSREKLQETIDLIRANLIIFEEWLPRSLKGTVTIGIADNGYLGCDPDGIYSSDLSKGLKIGKAIEINFRRIGKVRVGLDKSVYSLYRRIELEVNGDQETGAAIQQIQGMLSMLGLGALCFEARPEDEERKKIAFLFRTFFPQAAYKLERSAPFYEISIDRLKNMIIGEAPAMRDIFDRYLSDPSAMKEVEISPGFITWSIPDLSDRLRASGAIGLMSGVSGNPRSLAKMLLHGPLCSQERFERAQIVVGASSFQDHEGGGAGSVFLRMVTSKMTAAVREKIIEDGSASSEGPLFESACQVELFPYSRECQILYDLDVLNRGAYAYHRDRYGSKMQAAYAERLNLIDFTQSLSIKDVGNEVMIFEHIQPEYIKKILVKSEFSKQNLIEQFERENLTEFRDGQHFLKGYNGLSLEELIIVGKVFKPEMWS